MISITYQSTLQYANTFTGSRFRIEPVVAVRLSVGRRFVETQALVDSGAAYSIFDSQIAGLLGLSLREGRKISLIGLDGRLQYGYLHQVAIRLIHVSESWPVIKGDIVFKTNHPKELGNLLGRRDFFAALQIGFNEKETEVYLSPNG